MHFLLPVCRCSCCCVCPQKSSSFIGRQANAAVGVRSASNYGASRTFVFGSDPSNYSNPGAAGGGSNHGAPPREPQQPQQQGSDRQDKPVGPASFAGLGNLIAEAKGAAGGRQGGSGSSKPAGDGGGSSKLLSVLHSKAGGRAAPASNVITAAVGTKLADGTRQRQNGGARLLE